MIATAALASATPAPSPTPTRATTTAADPSTTSAERVQASVRDALEVLRDPAMQGREHRTERHTKLRTISDRVFDFSAMSQRSLGVHWRRLNAEQRQRFTNTFKDLLANYYLTQIDRFQGREEVVFDGVAKTGDGHEVRTHLVTGSGEKVPIHFLVNDAQRVVDVSIEGVSIANHYRGTFDRQLVNGTFDQMMARLERRRVPTRAAESEPESVKSLAK